MFFFFHTKTNILKFVIEDIELKFVYLLKH